MESRGCPPGKLWLPPQHCSSGLWPTWERPCLGFDFVSKGAPGCKPCHLREREKLEQGPWGAQEGASRCRQVQEPSAPVVVEACVLAGSGAGPLALWGMLCPWPPRSAGAGQGLVEVRRGLVGLGQALLLSCQTPPPSSTLLRVGQMGTCLPAIPGRSEAPGSSPGVRALPLPQEVPRVQHGSPIVTLVAVLVLWPRPLGRPGLFSLFEGVEADVGKVGRKQQQCPLGREGAKLQREWPVLRRLGARPDGHRMWEALSAAQGMMGWQCLPCQLDIMRAHGMWPPPRLGRSSQHCFCNAR